MSNIIGTALDWGIVVDRSITHDIVMEWIELGERASFDLHHLDQTLFGGVL